VQARLVDQYAHHYHLIVSIFKGVSLFAGATALHSIFIHGATLNVKLNALAFWLGSFTTIVITYDSIMVTTIISVVRPNAVDVVGPFLLGLGEFLQFTVLTVSDGGDGSRASAAGQLSQLSWWPLVFAFSTAAGWAIIRNYQRQLSWSLEHAPPQLAEGYRWIRETARRDLFGAGLAAVLMLVPFAALRGWEDLREWQGVIGMVVFAGNIGTLRNYDIARRKLAEGFRLQPAGEPIAVDQVSPPLPAPDPPV